MGEGENQEIADEGRQKTPTGVCLGGKQRIKKVRACDGVEDWGGGKEERGITRGGGRVGRNWCPRRGRGTSRGDDN